MMIETIVTLYLHVAREGEGEFVELTREREGGV